MEILMPGGPSRATGRAAEGRAGRALRHHPARWVPPGGHGPLRHRTLAELFDLRWPRHRNAAIPARPNGVPWPGSRRPGASAPEREGRFGAGDELLPAISETSRADLW